MFRKKQPVLTANYCQKMEKLRQAIEVLTGERISFVHIDFNTGRARMRTRSEFEFDVTFFGFYPNDLAHIGISVDSVTKECHWHTVRFDFDPEEVRIISNKNPVKRGPDRQHSMWWVGRSSTDRRLEPLDPRNVEYCAAIRGLSVEEYLSQKA